MATVDEYAAIYKTLIVCIAAREPVVIWGPPGQGKTSVIESIAAEQSRLLQVILASIREPQDFAGLPMLSNGVATLMPPDWAKRLADDKNGILFIDEVNTAPPSVQAALLRVCLDKVAGDCHLGENTSVVAAANPPELAADGWDLAPPLANRFCHLNWNLPPEVVRDGLAGNWISYSVTFPSTEKVESAIRAERAVLAGFLASRPDLTTVLPKSAVEQGRAFPTPRSWEMVAKLSGWITAANLDSGVRRIAVLGCVGTGAAAEYMTYRENVDLPNPEEILANFEKFKLPTRMDKVYVIGAALMSALRSTTTLERWNTVGKVLELIAKSGHPDLAVTFARDWIRIRPEGATPDKELLRSLVPLLTEAKMI
jgi:MoxR-like ATPase